MSLIVGLSFSNIAGGLAVGFAEKMNVSFVSFLVFIASFVIHFSLSIFFECFNEMRSYG